MMHAQLQMATLSDAPANKILVIIPIVTTKFNEALKKEISVVQASDFQLVGKRVQVVSSSLSSP